MSWIEVSLTVAPELAEAVAEVLARYVPNGVAIESTDFEGDPDFGGRPAGPLRVCGYLPVDEHLEAARHKIEEGLWYLSRIQPLPAPVFRPLQETDWVAAWKSRYRPILVGRRLIILPSWYDNPQPERLPIKIEPGMAFGTGTHPTTRLCLELMEKHILGPSARSAPPAAMIDVGCGSGILSIAAVRLGVARALGVDADAQALPHARENAALNGVLDRIEFAHGSVAEVRAGAFSLRQAPLVVVNILARILLRLFDQGLADLPAPGGRMILSGILEEQEGEIRAALERHGLDVLERSQMGDWVGLAAVSRTE